jgi:molybdopterin converting factor small subunit
MPVVWIPSLLRDLSGGQETVRIPGSTVREVIEGLDRAYPGFKKRVCAGEDLRPGIAIVVGTEIAALGLLQTVSETSEIYIVPAIAGG